MKAPPKRTRLWIFVAIAIVILLPAAAYLGTIAYINFGFMNNSVARQISELFDSSAHVGTISTQWLKNLRIENVRVDPSGSGQPLTIDSLRAEWDIGPLIANNRIRSVRIENPKLDLKRLDNGHWNFNYKPPEKPEAGGEIEQLQIDDGEFAISWGGGKNIRLQGIIGTLADNGPQALQFFTVRGVLDSLEKITANGTLGPGEAFNLNVSGGIQPDRDLTSAFGPDLGITGRVAYNLSMKHDLPANGSESGGPNRLEGRIDLENFEWALAQNLKLAVPERAVQFKTESDPGNALKFHDLKLSAEGIGTLSGNGVVDVGAQPHVDLTDARLKLFDLAEAQTLFKPPLLGTDRISLQGTLELSKATLQLPLGSNADFRAQGDLSAPNLHSNIRGLGELPACNVSAALNWPALTNAKFDFSGVLSLNADVKDVNPPGSNTLIELLRGTTIHELRMDVAKFCDTELGRRILSGNFDSNLVMTDGPVSLSGTLLVKDARPAITSEASQTRVSLKGIKLQDLAVRRWACEQSTPKLVLNADLEGAVVFAGSIPKCATINASLSGSTGKETPPLTGELAMDFAADANGNWQPGPLLARKLTLPLANLPRIIDLPGMNRISGEGKVEIASASYDFITGNGTIAATIDSPTIHLTIPDQLQPVILNLLRMTGHDVSAVFLENYPITSVDITGLMSNAEVKISNDAVSVHCSSKPAGLRIKLPIKIPVFDDEITAPVIPEAEIGFEAQLHPANGLRAYAFSLRWRGNNSLKIDARQDADERWTAQATLQGEFSNGKPVVVSAAYDAKKGQVGPLQLSIEQLDARILNTPDVASAGSIRNLKLELEPFLIRGTPRERTVTGRISATLDGLSFADEKSGSDGKLSGKLNGPVGYANGSATFNGLLKLTDYKASLHNGEFLISPPPAGKSGSINVALKSFKDGRGEQNIKIERCDIDLAGRLIVAMTGNWPLAQPQPNIDHLSVAVPPLVFGGSSLEGPFELHSPAGTASVDGGTTRKLLALSSVMEARSAKITEWKDAGTVGETSAGFLEIRAPQAAEDATAKDMRALVNSENTDRTALYNELARIYGLTDGGAESVGKLFARNYRNTAAANWWVQNPAENKWVLKKELNQ